MQAKSINNKKQDHPIPASSPEVESGADDHDQVAPSHQAEHTLAHTQPPLATLEGGIEDKEEDTREGNLTQTLSCSVQNNLSSAEVHTNKIEF